MRRIRRRVIQNQDKYLTDPSTGRALVSFLVQHLLLPPAYRDRFNSQTLMMESMVRSLNELGYVVDVVNWDNTSWRPSRHYDLFIGHGSINYKQISDYLSTDTIRIYYSTGTHWREQNVREAERIFNLAKRTGFLLPPDRANLNNEDVAYLAADAIICLGNREVVDRFSMFRNVFNINNPVSPLNWEGWHNKDYRNGSKHFLFFAGHGNIHKGLDLLLEVFAEAKDFHLHICQHLEPTFSRVFSTYLTALDNIHVYGFTKARSPEYDNLANLCDWAILPTCSEGQPGSTIECMAHGLIPILPDSANIDLEDWGVHLPDCEISTIRSVVEYCSRMPSEEIRQRATKVMAVTQESYSQEGFQNRFKAIVSSIVNNKDTVGKAKK